MYLSDIGQRVQTLLRQVPSTNGLFTSAELSAVINDANLDVCMDVDGIPATGSVYTVAGTFQYPLSPAYMAPNLLNIRAIYYDNFRVYQASADDDQWNYGDNKISGQPTKYRIWNGIIELDPTPDTANELRIEHWKKPALLQNNGDLPEIDTQYHMAIVYLACAYLTIKDEKELKYNTFYAKYINRINRLRQLKIGNDPESISIDNLAYRRARRHYY